MGHKYGPFLILDLLVGAYESMAAIQLWYVNVMVLISRFILLTGNTRMSIGPILLSVSIGQCDSPKCLPYHTFHFVDINGIDDHNCLKKCS
jgi:hypothetical protein